MLLPFALLCAGCQAPGGATTQPNTPGPLLLGGGPPQPPESNYIDIEHIPRQDDIVQIVQFWNPAPWVYNTYNRPVGFKVATYFISSTTELGAFVPGTVYAWLHVLLRDPQGQVFKKTVHMWQFGPDESFLFAVRKRVAGGYFYGFILTWPASLDLSGQTVEIEFAYERGDGKLVMNSPRMLKVPVYSGDPLIPMMPSPASLGASPGRPADAPEATEPPGRADPATLAEPERSRP